ncbi:MAG: hypothetical protein WCI51_08315 [Lentisphaerota bacterium]
MEELTVEQRAANRKNRDQEVEEFEKRFQDAVVKSAEIIRSVESPQFLNHPAVRKAILEAVEKLVLLPGDMYDTIAENYKDLI